MSYFLYKVFLDFITPQKYLAPLSYYNTYCMYHSLSVYHLLSYIVYLIFVYICVLCTHQLGIFGCKLQKLTSANLRVPYQFSDPTCVKNIGWFTESKENRITLWRIETEDNSGDLYRINLWIITFGMIVQII